MDHEGQGTRSAPPWAIRPASDTDADVLTEIVVAATKYQGRWLAMSGAEEQRWRETFAQWTRETIAAGEVSVVVDAEQRPIGRLRILRVLQPGDPDVEPHLELAGVQLHPNVQAHGFGTSIVKELQHEATEPGMPLDLGVEKDNPRARRLYERLGFVLVRETETEHLMRWRPARRPTLA